jgi:hypothetical protein
MAAHQHGDDDIAAALRAAGAQPPSGNRPTTS